MKAKLLPVEPSDPKRKVVLKSLPAMIGRGQDATVQVEDPWVSRRHCEIDAVGGTLVVRDLGSKHGTFVNGLGVAESHLLPGDKLTVGLTSFEAIYRAKAGRGSGEAGVGTAGVEGAEAESTVLAAVAEEVRG